MTRMHSRLDKLEKASGADAPEPPDYIWIVGLRRRDEEPVEGEPVNGHRIPIGAAAKGLPVDDGQGAIWKRDPTDGQLHPYVETDHHD
ncbi:MAG: hypothetical protein M3N34_07605 [Pseudomonadota bacterium]|nr:hypothetical protein [Pseudomonadota bacterium]